MKLLSRVKILALFSIILVVISCGDSNNARIIDGSSSLKPGGLGGSPLNPNTFCQHPDALNVGIMKPGYKEYCVFEACTTPGKAGFVQYLAYLDYLGQDGRDGEIRHKESLCKDDIDPGCEKCQHPEAEDFNVMTGGSCTFRACPLEGYLEYQKYLEFEKYIEESQHGGKIIEDETLCKTPKDYPGCLVSSADGDSDGKGKYNPNANLEDKTCKWRLCRDSRFKEFDDPQNILKLADLIKYVDEFDLDIEEHYESTCKTPKGEIPGCMEPTALNYNPKATVDGGCVCRWAACADPDYQEYLDPNNMSLIEIIKAYALKHGVNDYRTLITQSTCKDKRVKCEDPLAANFGKYEKCFYKACQNPAYEQYDFYLQLVSLGKSPIYADNSLCKDKKPYCEDQEAFNYHQYEVCKYKACGDPSYEEYALFELYTSQGKIVVADQSLCKKKKVTCNDPAAYNNGQPGVCKYKACGDPNYVEYTLFQQYQAQGKIVEADQSLCLTLKGCTHPLATNYNPEADIDDKSCKFKACMKPKTKVGYNWIVNPEYDEDIALSIQAYIDAHGLTGAIVTSTCLKNEYMIITDFDVACNGSVETTFKVNGQVKQVSNLSAEQPHAKAVHVKKNDNYNIILNNQEYHLEGGPASGQVLDHIKREVSCN